MPFGDLVFYLSANLLQTIDGPSTNTVSLTPGFRTHLGGNWYFLGGVEVPVTNAKPFGLSGSRRADESVLSRQETAEVTAA